MKPNCFLTLFLITVLLALPAAAETDNTVFDAYYDFLTDTLAGNSADKWRFDLAYIDGDDVPELLIALTDHTAGTEVQIYRYTAAGTVEFVHTFGENSSMYYVPRGNRVYDIDYAADEKNDDDFRTCHLTSGFYEMDGTPHLLAGYEKGFRCHVKKAGAKTKTVTGQEFAEQWQQIRTELYSMAKFDTDSRSYTFNEENFAKAVTERCGVDYEAYRKDKQLRTALNGYQAYLTSFLGDSEYRLFEFGIADLDSNGIPELICSAISEEDRSYVYDSFTVFTWADNKLTPVTDFPSYHTMNIHYSSAGDRMMTYILTSGASARSTSELTASYYSVDSDGVHPVRQLQYLHTPILEMPEDGKAMADMAFVGIQEICNEIDADNVTTHHTKSAFCELLAENPVPDRKLVLYRLTEENTELLNNPEICVNIPSPDDSDFFSAFERRLENTERLQ